MGLHGSGRGPSHTYSVALSTTMLAESVVHPFPSTSRRYVYLSVGAGSAAYRRGALPSTGSCMDTSRIQYDRLERLQCEYDPRTHERDVSWSTKLDQTTVSIGSIQPW
jgi:hypothetical protein